MLKKIINKINLFNGHIKTKKFMSILAALYCIATTWPIITAKKSDAKTCTAKVFVRNDIRTGLTKPTITNKTNHVKFNTPLALCVPFSRYSIRHENANICVAPISYQTCC